MRPTCLILVSPRPPSSTLFPYTTLFRSAGSERGRRRARKPHEVDMIVNQHDVNRSEEHTSELQSRLQLVCRLLLEKKKCQAPHTAIGPMRPTWRTRVSSSIRSLSMPTTC